MNECTIWMASNFHVVIPHNFRVSSSKSQKKLPLVCSFWRKKFISQENPIRTLVFAVLVIVEQLDCISAHIVLVHDNLNQCLNKIGRVELVPTFATIRFWHRTISLNVFRHSAHSCQSTIVPWRANVMLSRRFLLLVRKQQNILLRIGTFEENLFSGIGSQEF